MLWMHNNIYNYNGDIYMNNEYSDYTLIFSIIQLRYNIDINDEISEHTKDNIRDIIVGDGSKMAWINIRNYPTYPLIRGTKYAQ